MEHEGVLSPVAVIAQRVRQLRARKQMTAQQLAERLRQTGVPWDRATVTKLETGRRQNVTITEVLALALVLDVAPTNLFIVLDNSPYKVTPARTEPADLVRAWVRGEEPLPGTDERTFRTEVSLADMHKAHTAPSMDELVGLIARFKGVSVSDAHREIADRMDEDMRKRGIDLGGGDHTTDHH